MWSVGCIFAEMLSGFPLFDGDSDIDQLVKMFRVRGNPTELSWPGITKLMNNSNVGGVDMMQNTGMNLEEVLGRSGVPTTAYDLLERMLSLNPKRRITALQALKHPYFAGEEELLN